MKKAENSSRFEYRALPDTYFDEMPKRYAAQAFAPSHKSYSWAWAVAASVVLVVGLSVWFWPAQPDSLYLADEDLDQLILEQNWIFEAQLVENFVAENDDLWPETEDWSTEEMLINNDVDELMLIEGADML